MSDRQIYDLVRAQLPPLGGAYVQTASGRHHFREFLPLAAIRDLRRQFQGGA